MQALSVQGTLGLLINQVYHCVHIWKKKNTKVLLHLPRACLCSRAYFVISRMSMCEMCMRKICTRMCKNLHTHAYEILMRFSTQKTQAKTLKIAFLTGWPWPMTLTFELVQDIIKVNPCTKFHDRTPNGSAVRALTDRHTDTQTAPFL